MSEKKIIIGKASDFTLNPKIFLRTENKMWCKSAGLDFVHIVLSSNANL